MVDIHSATAEIIGEEKKDKRRKKKSQDKTRMWPMPNVMAALPNIGDALCSTPQRFADAHYSSALQ